VLALPTASARAGTSALGEVMDLGLANRVAIVTGSSRGIGWACAECLLKECAAVVVTGRRPETARGSCQRTGRSRQGSRRPGGPRQGRRRAEAGPPHRRLWTARHPRQLGRFGDPVRLLRHGRGALDAHLRGKAQRLRARLSSRRAGDETTQVGPHRQHIWRRRASAACADDHCRSQQRRRAQPDQGPCRPAGQGRDHDECGHSAYHRHPIVRPRP
jgi:hypothetical protein